MNEGYDPTFFSDLERIEDRHFWFRARRRVVGAVLRQITENLPSGYHVLDLGCGTGGMLHLMQDCSPGGKVVGMDLYSQGLQYARRRCDCPLVQADMQQSPFGEAFAVIGMFDVLEHLNDDVGLLRNVAAMLISNGTVLITVPAHMTLWSYFDVAAHHARRYSENELATKLTQAGLEVTYVTQFMRPLFPLVWLGRRVKGVFGAASNIEKTRNELRITPGLNELLGWALAGEKRLIRNRKKMSIGTSLLAVARRKT